MITETATVVQVDEDRVVVEAAIKTTCSSCQAQSDCGTGAISRALAPRVQQLTLRSPVPVKVGDTVQVGIPEAGIVSASALLYLLPLAIFIASAVLFSATLPGIGLVSELWVLLGSVVVTLAGFVALSGWIKQLDGRRFEPVLLAKSPSSVSPGKPAA